MKRILSILFLFLTLVGQSQEIKSPILINPGGSLSGGTVITGTGIIGVYNSLAPTNGTTDASIILQDEIDYCIAHQIRVLQLSNGTYKVDNQLILALFYAGNYVGFGLEIRGQGNMWDIRTTIQASFYDKFIIGIQHGKGVTLRGIRIRGNFTPPLGTDYEYYNRSFASCTDGLSRDSQYSPNCAVAIDPFTNTTGVLPSDGGYPGLSAWYKGTASTTSQIQAGSTATTIVDCITEKTVVGICSSPNGYTRNAEITLIDNVQFRFHKLCVSGGQEQEKQNTIRNCANWYASYMFFATGKYGRGTPGNWVIDGVNIAGYMVQFIDNDQNGYFPTFVKHVYTERLGKFGLMTNYAGRLAATVEDCSFTFTEFTGAGYTTVINAGNNVEFKNCSFRYYGFLGFPMLIQGNGTFRNCAFSGYPIFIGNYVYPRFIDCYANSAHLGLTGIKTLATEQFHPYGDWTIMDYGAVYNVADGIPANVHTAVKSSSQDIYTSFAPDASVSATIVDHSFSFTSSAPNAYFGGMVVQVGSGNFGVASSVSGSTVTINYLPLGMADGTYGVKVYYPVLYNGIFMGDISNGSTTILNYRGATVDVNYIIKNPYGGSKYLKVLSVSGSTITFYGSVTQTKVGAIFGNYTSQEVYTDNPGVDAFPNNYIVRKGDKVIEQKSSENEIVHVITAGGFLDATGSGDTRQATWTP